MKFRILIISLIAAIAVQYPAFSQEAEISEDKVYELMFTDYEAACKMMEQLRKQGELPQWQLDITEGDLHFNNGKARLALEYYTRASSAKELAADKERELDLIHRRISCYDAIHDDAAKTALCQELYDKAGACGNAPMQSVALFNLGKTAYLQEDKQQGYRLMEEAVQIMESSEYEYRYDNLTYNLNTLILYNLRDGQNEQALNWLQRAQNLEKEEDKAGRETDAVAKRQNRILLAYKTVILSNLGREKEADKTYSDYLQARAGRTSEDYIIMPYLFKKGKYEDVINMNKARRSMFLSQGDSVNYYMLTIDRSIANAYMEMGKPDSAAVYYKALAELTDRLKKQEQESYALELASLYESEKKDREIERQHAELKAKTVFIVLMLLLIALAGGFAVYACLNLKKLRSKNSALANEVSELIDCRQQLYAAKVECARLRSLAEPQAACAEQEEEKSGNELWEEIDRDIIGNRLYLDHDFTRATVMAKYRIPKNMFASVFKDNTGTSFTRYINNLRLEHSVALMKEKPYFTISAIASESGFPNPSTFYRLFYERFSMTPSEYIRTERHRE